MNYQGKASSLANFSSAQSKHSVSPLSAAYLVHTRPLGENSLIVELITETHGRIAAVANGAKRKNSAIRSILQPFRPILVSWRGLGDLKTIVRIESPTLPLPLSSQYLYSGLYLNELILRLLAKEDPQPQIYSSYHATLIALSKQLDIEQSLRLFEFCLLNELGHGFTLTLDHTGHSIQPDWQYRYHPDLGLMSKVGGKFSGQHLLAIAKHDFCDKITRNQAKALTRQALAPLLGNKPLHSRQLFARRHINNN
jgi:DNA repair protein RecO (recombination protein O)